MTSPKKKPNTISVYRKKIDDIDSKILNLLSQRGKAAEQIGKIKRKNKLPFHIPEREEQLITRLKKANSGPFSNEAIGIIYREIISASLALETPLKVAYLGPEATYSHLAAIRKFGISANLLPQKDIRSVFIEVANSRTDYAIAPVENSIEGVVNQTLDLFLEFPLKISSEIQIPIHHNLLSNCNDFQKIKEVYSHVQAIAQCRQWLEKNLPQATLVPVASTSKAAEIAAQKKQSAAIASEVASSIYNIAIQAQFIEDKPNNYTRFIVIGSQETNISGNDKTSVMFSTSDEPGILYKILRAFADEKINLSTIESRPAKKTAWEYVFFIDMDGHIKEENMQRAIHKMKKYCAFLRILGSYPKAVFKKKESTFH